MRVFLQRFMAVCLAVLLGALAGGATGFLLGRHWILDHAQRRVAAAAEDAAGELSSAVGESRGLLKVMNASSDAFCSPADVERLRTLVFQSHHLKEAGRIRDGRVACSSTLGPVANLALPQPDLVQKDGTLVYRNLPSFQIAGHTTIAVAAKSAFVVYNPFNTNEELVERMHYSIFATDTRSHTTGVVFGEPAFAGQSAQLGSTAGIAHGQIYATRCAAPGMSCVSVYTPVAEVTSSSAVVLGVLAVLGALLGGMLGGLLSQLYRTRQGLAAQLLEAIRDGRLSVVYQPIVDLDTGMIVEAEALVRWSEAQGGAIGPDVFVRIAEERGFVGEITRFVVRRVLDEMGGVMRRRRDFRVSVNVAAQDLADPDFVPMLKNQLTRADVQPETLGIEITESFTARHQVARDTIARLRRLGHHVAIDDFGTGYSSLAYLHDLAADTIKIDKVFTQAIGTEAITVSILPQILSIAAKLDLNVTVEGIETDEQARYFVGAPMRVRAQGWLFGHPVSSVALQELLAKDDARIAARTGHGTLTVISSKR